MNCIIIDDDKVAQKAIQFLIEKTAGLALLGTFEEPLQAMPVIDKKEVDLILLDIEMPGLNGLDFLKNFTNLPQIIICSSKKEYAADVFEFKVTDYLVKPVTYERFGKAVGKAREARADFRFTGVKDDSFFIKNKGNYLNIRAKDVLYFEALSDYVIIHTLSGKYTIYSTMHAIESKLSGKDFVRIHRSYIIRLDQITAIEEGVVHIKDTVLPVSKSYKKDLNSRLNFL